MRTRMEKKLLFFRIQLAKQLVNNSYLPGIINDKSDKVSGVGTEVVMVRRSTHILMQVEHDYVAAPKKAKKILTESRV